MLEPPPRSSDGIPFGDHRYCIANRNVYLFAESLYHQPSTDELIRDDFN